MELGDEPMMYYNDRPQSPDISSVKEHSYHKKLHIKSETPATSLWEQRSRNVATRRLDAAVDVSHKTLELL